jgi:hypothetical protein
MNKPVFEGLVVDESDHPLKTAYVGVEPFYVLDDSGFLRHISAEKIDREVLKLMMSEVKENEQAITEQTAKMLGQEDIFTTAMIRNQLEHLDSQIDSVLKTGIPAEGRTYLGMMGFKVVVNLHGEIVKVEQPSKAIDEDGDS